MTDYLQMYKMMLLPPSPPPPWVTPWLISGGQGGVRQTLRMCQEKKTYKYLGQNKPRDNTCSSSCCTTCICTRHWAVLLSSRACSLLRCLENKKEGTHTHKKKSWCQFDFCLLQPLTCFKQRSRDVWFKDAIWWLSKLEYAENVW